MTINHVNIYLCVCVSIYAARLCDRKKTRMAKTHTLIQCIFGTHFKLARSHFSFSHPHPHPHSQPHSLIDSYRFELLNTTETKLNRPQTLRVFTLTISIIFCSAKEEKRKEMKRKERKKKSGKRNR